MSKEADVFLNQMSFLYQLPSHYRTLSNWLVCSSIINLFDGPDDEETSIEKQYMMNRVAIEPSFLIIWLKGVRAGIENDAYTSQEVMTLYIFKN